MLLVSGFASLDPKTRTHRPAQEQSEALEAVLTAACGRKAKPVVVAVGATVQPGLAETAQAMGWMTDPEVITIGTVSALNPEP